MPRDLILATAGHIDHGKTMLVKALTGTDCDRLPEEQERGITIDIGFALLDLGDYRFGVVDVPGHERFVKNMLAGATGADVALLIVASDDSVMPQTREHLDILKLLGVRRGVIALTKTDLVDDTRRESAIAEIRALVRGSFLENAPIIPTSVITGVGIDQLKAELASAAAASEITDTNFPFRLPIDRAIVIQGHGTVVTGSVASGKVRVGDELDWHKGDGTLTTVRVRGVTNHGVTMDEAHRGQRAGLNLAGVPHEAVRRGQELCSHRYLVPSRVLTVRLVVCSDASRPVKHRHPIHFHAGTTETMGTVSLLDCDKVEPGGVALAQLFLNEHVTTVWGQAFVLRDTSAQHTLGGGQVVRPVTGKLRRRHIEVLERIEQLQSVDPLVRVRAAAWFAGFAGLNPNDLVRDVGVTLAVAEEQLATLHANHEIAELTVDGQKLQLHTDRIVELEGRVLDTLTALHAANPLTTSHDRKQVLAKLEYVGNDPLLQAIADRLIITKKLVGDSRRIASADFKPKLTANQMKLKDRIVEAHIAAGFQPPEPKEFSKLAGAKGSALQEIFEVAVAEGLLVKVADGVYLAAESDVQLRRRIQEQLQTGAGKTVAEIRDILGTTRKFAVPICEYLDRIGVTKREGDLRILAMPGKV